MKKFILSPLFLISIICLSFKSEKNAPLWLRYPSISPDGKNIVFCYKGDIYKVDAAGGNASPITVSDSYDFMPIWSPDGKWIAFASDRNGGFDIYLMSADGGEAKRLTYYSSDDIPSYFTEDGKNVVFLSIRTDDVKFTQFPSGRLPELYAVPVGGGRETQVLSICADDARISKSGDKMIFHDRKGYENDWRKHHTSSVTRDVWMYNKKDEKFTQLTTFDGEDRNPVFSPDEKNIFFLSEKSGSFNIWKMEVNDPTKQTQVTKFSKNPVRFLTMASSNVLCYGYNGEIYTQTEIEDAKKIRITISTDERYPSEKIENFTTGATEMNVSPNGKEVVFVTRGEVFVTSVEGGTTKRITNTPGQERSASFSSDGKSIVYASERNNIWGIYKTDLVRKEESFFFNSTILKEEALVVGTTEAFQPKFSPDGNEVGYLEDRTAVKVLNLKTKKIRTILPAEKNYSYSDGDQSFDWSPDGKYLLVHFLQDGNWRSEVGLADAEGKNPIIDLTQSGFDNGGAKWAMNGKAMIWNSSRHGMKNIASHGNQSDMYGLFFTKAAYERFTMKKEDYALLKEKEDKDKDKDKSKSDTTKKASAKPVKIEMEGLEDRKSRLTIHSSLLADALLSPDGEKLFYITKFEGGFDLWQTKFKENETKLFVKLDAGDVGEMMFDKDAKNIFFVAGGKLMKINIEKAEKKEISFNAEMNMNLAAERAEMYEHVWRQVVKKFYVTDLQKTDWNYYKQNYQTFLPYINNNRDYAEMLSELLGELNASHTGCGYRGNGKRGDETANLGAFFDPFFKGAGLKIIEVIAKGPLVNDGSEIKAGTIIEKINGVEITPETNHYKLLNRLAGKPTLLSLYDETTKKRWEETVKPFSNGQVSNLLYLRWIKRMQDMTDKLSNGQIGYMHVKGMDDESFREFYDQVMGKYVNKKALIVDTRFNGGGWLHDDLATFLSGKQYINFIPRERKVGVEPANKWIKTSCVLMGEGNYSDAHMFPVVYKTLGIGKLIGMPVPGTGTAVWWETMQDPSLVFGIPQVGVVTMDGKYYENNQLEPDYKVLNDYGSMLKGEDQQIKEAVKLLLNPK
ncbi:MAG: S41 family peptidase [Bacteroidota bacterium]|nr:S41 family peptidase [Bacteroidota bacterium]